MSSPEFPTYTHIKKTTGIGFPGESPVIGGNVSGAVPQGTVTPIDWIPTNAGMAFTGNVAIGTNTPSNQYSFYVVNNTNFNQNVNIVGVVTAAKFVGDGSGLTNLTVENYWANTSVGVSTLANVGIGTTNPTSKLTVSGNIIVSGVSTFSGGITTVTGTTLFARQVSVSGIITDSKGEIRQIPRSTNTTVVSTDAGKFLDISAGVTINASTAFATGEAVTIFNNSSSSITITATGVTLRQAGTSNTGNRTVGAYGLVTVLCVASNTYVVGGAGLT